MACKFGTPEWVTQYEKAVQGSAEYKELAKDWEGSIGMRVLPNPDIGIDEALYIFMDLWHGDARSIKLVPKEEGEKADYLITGEYARWKSVVKGDLDIVKGMMAGQLKLRGDLPTIVKYATAATKLVELTSTVESIFPDELSSEELDRYKARFKETRDQLKF